MSEEIEIEKRLTYQRVEQDLLLLIEQGSYQAGDRIPSERSLSEQFSVHRVTLRRAIDRLVDKGVVERRGTSGTYLTSPVIIRPISANAHSHSISEIVHSCGGKPGNKLLYFQHDAANSISAAKLQIAEGSPVLIVKRLRLVDDLPFCVEITALPMNRVPGLTAEDFIGENSLYGLLEERYNIEVVTSKATVSVGSIPHADSEFLGLKRDESALIIHSVMTDTKGEPVEFLTSLNHPRRVNLAVE